MADSSSPGGSSWKKFLTTIRLNALMAPGSMRAQKESSDPRLLTTRYVGIIPPENSMEKTTRFSTVLRPMRSLRASG
ncbi:hypothetical protein LJK88_18915 [Paenibacillus sp. P26]|nr:hypothetical protein LJK88_18915 [Paenibacillus sp. P26]